MKHAILGAFVGTPRKLGDSDQISAMVKDSVDFLEIKKDRLIGHKQEGHVTDQVANLKYHGGPDRVIHHYSVEQYEHLKEKFPEHAGQFIIGTYGENITTDRLTEKDLCLGDIFLLGTARVELSEPRKPCSTIDNRYGFKGVLKEIVQSRKYGWFYRVLDEGHLRPGDDLELLERPYESLRIDKIIYEVFQAKEKNKDFLQSCLDCPALSERFSIYVKRALEKA